MRRRWAQESGATAVEYGLILVACGIVLVTVGPFLADAFITILNVVLDAILGV